MLKISIEVLDVPLDHLLTKKSGEIIFEHEPAKIWNLDGISLKRREAKQPSLKRRVTKALQPTNLNNYLVVADPAAPTRCIDGRIIEGWADDTAIQNRPLGPKIAGGTPHAALTHRIVDVDNLRRNLVFEEDIRYVIQQYKEIGIGFGGHVDDHQKGWNTGCGAVDNINLILEKVQRPGPQQQLRGLTRLIMGDAYNGPKIGNEVIGRMLFLDSVKPSYMPRAGGTASGEFLYKKTIVETLRAQATSNKEPVEKLTGPHNEVAVVLNFVKGMTFDTDRFGFDNQNEIQVFGWDVWEIYEEAARLYPYDMYADIESQRDSVWKRIKHVTTRTLLGVATTMVLTDGSLRVVLVK